MSFLSWAISGPLEPWGGKGSETPLDLRGRRCRDGLLMSVVRGRWAGVVHRMLGLSGQYLDYVASFLKASVSHPPRG